ncbi:MAG: LPS export ABC transporter permease LptG [Alphaproteobacteria bacterium]|nr:LPS export ABC transporter permease LptG [Alphaproteobacteria bacterium]
MRLPLTLSLYICRQFLSAVLYSVLALTLVAMLIDTVELIRRASGKEGVPLSAILHMALLKSPGMAERLLPFAVLVGSLLALSRMTRTQELVVARAAGVSVWKFLLPAVVSVMLLGVVNAMVFNPMASLMLLRFEKIEGRYLMGKPSLLAVSPSGLWLRQMEPEGHKSAEHIIHAVRMSQGDMSFSGLVVFSFDRQGHFLERLDAETAALLPGRLEMTRVIRSVPGQPPQPLPRYVLPTTLKLEHIQDSFASPETISFWKLPSFIEVLENAGFSALRHRIYWQSMLSSPFVYAGMVLIAAVFALRLPRLGKVGMFLVAGMAAGFLLYFFTDIVHALGMAGTLPVFLAAWTPAAIVLMLGGGTLLHLEDG